MATYSTDLTTLTTAESGTWTEFASPYNAGGAPGLSEENFIQGTDCYAQNSGKAVGLEISIVFDYGSGYSYATDEVVFAWLFYAVGTNLETYANNGWRFGIGSSISAWDWFRIGGSDYGRNPYGGWVNVAVDPTATETGTVGGGNGGSYRYYGNVPYTINEISKGDPTAVDAIRAGRGLLSMTGSGGSLTELASYNDYNDGGTPPGSSSTSVDSGYHRLGLFQVIIGGVILWKGLLSLGTSGSSVTLSDSNKTIIIDDCPHTYADFNKIEIHNASSTITLVKITITSTATTANGLGYFEMVDNATVALTGCAFNGMGTFIFDSNATITSCAFNTCGQITSGGADIVGCDIIENTASSAIVCASPAEAALITGCTFESDGTGHAIEITGTAANITLTGNIFTGYDTSDPGTAANKAIFVNIASGTMSITISGGSGVTEDYHVRSAGATVTVNSDVTITFTGLKDNSEIWVFKTSDDSLIAETEDATDGSPGARTFSWSAPASTNVYYMIHNFESGVTMYESIRVEGYVVPSTDTSIPIQQRLDRNVT